MRKLKYNFIVQLSDELKIYIVKDENQLLKLITEYQGNEIEIKPL